MDAHEAARRPPRTLPGSGGNERARVLSHAGRGLRLVAVVLAACATAALVCTQLARSGGRAPPLGAADRAVLATSGSVGPLSRVDRYLQRKVRKEQHLISSLSGAAPAATKELNSQKGEDKEPFRGPGGGGGKRMPVPVPPPRAAEARAPAGLDQRTVPPRGAGAEAEHPAVHAAADVEARALAAAEAKERAMQHSLSSLSDSMDRQLAQTAKILKGAPSLEASSAPRRQAGGGRSGGSGLAEDATELEFESLRRKPVTSRSSSAGAVRVRAASVNRKAGRRVKEAAGGSEVRAERRGVGRSKNRFKGQATGLRERTMARARVLRKWLHGQPAQAHDSREQQQRELRAAAGRGHEAGSRRMQASVLAAQGQAEELRPGWGLQNPENGIMRVECGDSVADGGGGTNAALRPRFWGPVGTRYTVQCPAECGKFDTTVWGCERFLDSSSICKAAIMSGKIGFESGGYVSFELVDPHPSYQGCAETAVSEVPVPQHRPVTYQTFTSMPYTWYSWNRADRHDAIAKLGAEGAQLKYRTTCASRDDAAVPACFGLRAFELQDADLDFVPPPIVRVRGPHDGGDEARGDGVAVGGVEAKEIEYEGSATVTLTAPKCVSEIYYTLDGSEPTLSSHAYKGPIRVAKEGLTQVNAISYTALRPPYTSDMVSSSFMVIAAALPPQAIPAGGGQVGAAGAGAVQVVIGRTNISLVTQEADDSIYFTTDGSLPSATDTSAATLYVDPIAVTAALVAPGQPLVIHALAVSRNLSKVASPVTTDVYYAVEACSQPSFMPASGAELVPLEGDRLSIACASAGCQAVYTEDGRDADVNPPFKPVPGPLDMSPGTYVVMAACRGAGFASSTVASAQYVVRVRSGVPAFVPHQLYSEEALQSILIVPAAIGSTIIFTTDGSVPVAGPQGMLTGRTYTCGVNTNTSLPSDGEELGGGTGLEGQGRRLLDVKTIGEDGGDGLVLADEDVTSELTVDGCKVEMGPGTYRLRARALDQGVPCVGCPSYAPSRIVTSGLYVVDPPLPPTDKARPVITFWREGEGEAGDIDGGHEVQRDTGDVIILKHSETLYAQLTCPGAGDVLRADGSRVAVTPVPRYTMDGEAEEEVETQTPQSITPFSFLANQVPRGGGGQTARIAVPVGVRDIRAVCYQGHRLLSTVLTTHIVVLKQPRPPVCIDNGKVFGPVERATVFLDMPKGEGDLEYAVNDHSREQTCAEAQEPAGQSHACALVLSAQACHQPVVVAGGDGGQAGRRRLFQVLPAGPLSPPVDGGDEETLGGGAQGEKGEGAKGEVDGPMPAAPPCVYTVRAYVKPRIAGDMKDAYDEESVSQARSEEVECTYTVQGPATSVPPRLSLPPGRYTVAAGGSLELAVECGPEANGQAHVGIDEAVMQDSPPMSHVRLLPGSTTVSAICVGTDPLTYPSAVFTGMYVVREAAPMVKSSVPSKSVFMGKDEGVWVKLTDTSHSQISYSLQPLAAPAGVQVSNESVSCGADSCRVFLSSECNVSRDISPTGLMAMKDVFGIGPKDGCAYTLRAWAQSETRVRGPDFVGHYLVVPHPVAEAPVFRTVIPDGGEEEGEGHFVVSPGGVVKLIIACPTSHTQPAFSVDSESEEAVRMAPVPVANDMGHNSHLVALASGTHVYQALCKGPEARPSSITSKMYTLVVRALPPQASAPNGTEFLGGVEPAPAVRLYLPEGPNARGSIVWTAEGGGGMRPASGVCSGTDPECWIRMVLPECEPWVVGHNSCHVTIRASTRLADARDSSTVEWKYAITPPPPVDPPTFAQVPGGLSYDGGHTFVEAFGHGVLISISCQDGAEPRYTRNGESPTRFSTPYTGPIDLQRGVSDLRAICVRDGFVGSSGVTRASFRVVTDSPDDDASFTVENISPPPSSNPAGGEVLDTTALSAVELLRAKDLGTAEIKYKTQGAEGGSEELWHTCASPKPCDVPLPRSCGAASIVAKQARGARAAVSCAWTISASETAAQESYLLPSVVKEFHFTLSFAARAARPRIEPAGASQQALAPLVQVAEFASFVVDEGQTLLVHVYCETVGTIPRYSLGVTAQPSRAEDRDRASSVGSDGAEMELEPGQHVVRAVCVPEDDNPHMLASAVEEKLVRVVERAPTPSASPVSHSLFSRVFSATVTLTDELSEAVISYRIRAGHEAVDAGGESKTCSGSQCSIELSSACDTAEAPVTNRRLLSVRSTATVANNTNHAFALSKRGIRGDAPAIYQGDEAAGLMSRPNMLQRLPPTAAPAPPPAAGPPEPSAPAEEDEAEQATAASAGSSEAGAGDIAAGEEGDGDVGTRCNYTITATANAPGRATSLPGVFSFTVTMPPRAEAVLMNPSPPPAGQAVVLSYGKALSLQLSCPDASSTPRYVVTPADNEEAPEVSQFSTAYTGPIELRPNAAAAGDGEEGVEGVAQMIGDVMIHARCYSTELRPSRLVTARYVLEERAPPPQFAPVSGTVLEPNSAGQGEGVDGLMSSPGVGATVVIRMQDSLPEAEIKYSVNDGPWTECSDGNDLADGAGESRCTVPLSASCMAGASQGTPDAAERDAHGYALCPYHVRAVAYGGGMADSAVEDAQYVMRVAPPVPPPVFSPDPTKQLIVDAGPDGAAPVSVACSEGEAHYTFDTDGIAPTPFSPLYSSNGLYLRAGKRVVTAMCYLPARRQQSEAITVTYTVLQRAPPPLATPPSGTPLAADSGTVPVRLSVPLAGSVIALRVNGGKVTVCAMRDECRLELPVDCPQPPTTTDAKAEGGGVGRRLLLWESLVKVRKEKGLGDSSSARLEAKAALKGRQERLVEHYKRIIERSRRREQLAHAHTDRMERHPPTGAATPNKTTLFAAAAGQKQMEHAQQRLQEIPGQRAMPAQAAATVPPVCVYSIEAVAGAHGYVDSRPVTFRYSVADTKEINSYSEDVLRTHAPAWSESRDIKVDINSISLGHDHPVVFSQAEQGHPVDMYDLNPPVITDDAVPVYGESPPQYGPHEYGGTY